MVAGHFITVLWKEPANTHVYRSYATKQKMAVPAGWSNSFASFLNDFDARI